MVMGYNGNSSHFAGDVSGVLSFLGERLGDSGSGFDRRLFLLESGDVP